MKIPYQNKRILQLQSDLDNKKNGEGIFKWANNSEYKG